MQCAFCNRVIKDETKASRGNFMGTIYYFCNNGCFRSWLKTRVSR